MNVHEARGALRVLTISLLPFPDDNDDLCVICADKACVSSARARGSPLVLAGACGLLKRGLMPNDRFYTLILSVIVMTSTAPLGGCSADGGSPPAGPSATNSGASAGTTTSPAAGAGGAAGSATLGGSGGAAGDGAGTGGSDGGTAGSGGMSAGMGGGGSGGSSGGSAGSSYGGFSYGGTSAGPTRTCASAEGSDALLDDFEDTDTSINAVDGRNGKWSVNSDGSADGLFTGAKPTAGSGRDGSAGWCMDASGFATWGANLVLTPLTPACGYDASIHKGVCFWAKGKVDAGGPIEFGIGTGDTVPTSSGGSCVLIANCWYGHVAAIDELDPENYKEYCFSWDELKQWDGSPEPAKFELDPESIVQMEWKFTARGPDAPTNGTLCIDDVRFMTE